jgi:transcription initiation factor TFIIIB Brf1 subunit/transcription initiation factor TFIIB
MSAGDSNGARGSRVQHASASAAYQQLCRSCRVPTEMVEDRAAGDVICRECGLVHEAHRIDESSEWRNFADSVRTHSVSSLPFPISTPLSPFRAPSLAPPCRTQTKLTAPEPARL